MIEHADAAAALLAARAQFAITIGLHIVLAAFSIGLAQWLMALEAWWLWRRQPAVLALYRYWLKVFALTVAAGTAFGLVMEYQFGLNWARLSLAVGEIIGPLMLYEVLVAFFLKAGFLGVMLFGQNKVGPKLHFFATYAVACALALVLVLGYSWLGACWLYWRCEGPLQRRAASQAKLLCGLCPGGAGWCAGVDVATRYAVLASPRPALAARRRRGSEHWIAGGVRSRLALCTPLAAAVLCPGHDRRGIHPHAGSALSQCHPAGTDS
ncbi:Cytochrome bd terminal oxidase subunit I [Pseudomonas soli]|uniref:Cytochrome bd terminal oxidase subunit I n=1 Tax=Pseudomonas soli TaxID=1306993 RepID=A0A1H8ZC14_9PSED|nr:Cytochrome bd terminal oxidase subunit I [Pseudomonas soli]